jgi:hypothetical protein
MNAYLSNVADLSAHDSNHLATFLRCRSDLFAFATTANLSFKDAAAWLARPIIVAALKAMDALRVEALLRIADEARLACFQILMNDMNQAQDPGERRECANALMKHVQHPLGAGSRVGNRTSETKGPPHPEPAFTPKPLRKAKPLILAVASAMSAKNRTQPNAGIATLIANLAPAAEADGNVIPVPGPAAASNQADAALPTFDDTVHFALASCPLNLLLHAASWSHVAERDTSDAFTQRYSVDLEIRPRGSKGRAQAAVIRIEASLETQGVHAGCWLISRLSTVVTPLTAAMPSPAFAV